MIFLLLSVPCRTSKLYNVVRREILGVSHRISNKSKTKRLQHSPWSVPPLNNHFTYRHIISKIKIAENDCRGQISTKKYLMSSYYIILSQMKLHLNVKLYIDYCLTIVPVLMWPFLRCSTVESYSLNEWRVILSFQCFEAFKTGQNRIPSINVRNLTSTLL